MEPRIYTYKITFEGAPYWYWGAHKEKVFGELYLGSPKYHKGVWEIYEAKIEILDVFPYTDQGWESATLAEREYIKPDLNNPLCLNEHCGGSFSLESRRKGGRKGGSSNARNKTGFCGRSLDQMREQGIKLGEIYGKLNGEANVKQKRGFCGRTLEKMREDGLKQPRDVRVRNGKGVCNQKWKCLVTGHVSNPPGLTNYQKARGIDTSLRVRVG